MFALFQKFRILRIVAFAVVMLLSAAFLASFQHHHEDAESHHDCGLCFLIQTVTTIIFAVFLLLGRAKRFLLAIPVDHSKPGMPLFVHSLQNRPPPVPLAA